MPTDRHCIVARCRVRLADDAAPIGDDQQIDPVCAFHAAQIEEHPEWFRIRVETLSGVRYRIRIDRVEAE
jgi:hypothetical protein